MADKTPPKPRRRGRRLLTAFVLVAGAGVAAGYVFLDANRYKDPLEAYLLNRTGLVIELGAIEWGTFPEWHAHIDAASVSGEGWRADIRNISATGSLTALFGREVRIDSIRADDVILHLPDSPRDWLDVYRNIADGLRPRERTRPRRVHVETIGPIVVDRVELHSNDFPGPILAAKVSVSDVMANEIQIDIDGFSPTGGSASRVVAAATLGRVRGEGLTHFTGSGGIDNLNLNGLLPELPPVMLNANIETTSTDPKQIGVSIAGLLEASEHPALNGDLSGMFWYTPEHVSINDIRYTAPGAAFVADITRHRTGELAVEVARAMLDGEALDAFLEQARRDSVYLTAAEPGAHLTAEDVLFGIRADGEQEFTQGSLAFAGLAVHDRSGHAYETNIRGRGHMKGRHITVETIEGDHSRFSGVFEPDFENATIAYNAAGTVTVTEDVLPPRVADRFLPNASLPITITDLHGSYTRGERPGATLAFEAGVGPGAVRLTVADVDAAIDVTGGSLHFEDGVLDIALDARAPEFGLVSATGNYAIADRSVAGIVECDVPQVLPNFIPGIEPGSMYTPILDQFGRARIAVSTVIPESVYDTVAVEFTHVAEPPLEGAIAFARDPEGGLRLGDMRVTGTLESGTLDDRMKGPFVVTGPVDVQFTRDGAAEAFRVHVDGAPASVRFGQRLEKRPADPLFVEITGAAPRSGWSADQLIVTAFDERIPVAFVDGGLLLEPATINLAAVTRLAPEGGFLDGNATLGFDTRSDQFLFGFDNASFSFGDDLGLDVLDGAVRMEQNRMDESRLRLRNPAGECEVRWTRDDGQWKGIVRGSYLDVDALQRILDSIRRASGAEAADPEVAAPGGPAEYPLDGTLEIELDRVKYRRAYFTRVTASGTATADAIRLPIIHATAYDGRIEGTVDLLAGTPGTMHAHFTFNNVDIAVLDDIYFEGERGFYGRSTGQLMFSAPMGSVTDMLAAGNGSGELTAHNGTFGEAGWATRFLSVLKTVEIFALRSPWRDEGLSFDTFTANFIMVDGRADLHDTELTTASYKMDAGGYMDFGKNQTDIRVNVNLLQSINRIAQHIPIIRNIADLTTERIAVRVNVTGPPDDLQFSVPGDAGIIRNVIGVDRDRSN